MAMAVAFAFFGGGSGLTQTAVFSGSIVLPAPYLPPFPIEANQYSVASARVQGDQFGYSTAINGGDIVVGAPLEDVSGFNAGSIYVFGGSTDWSQAARPAMSGLMEGDQFGFSVALSGSFALVGAWGGDDSGSASGAAYVLDRSANWRDVAKLTASDGTRGDEFGYAVSIDGGLAIVGARLDDEMGPASGSAYLFDGSTGWGQVTKLTAADEAANDQFGSSVAIRGDLAIVGAPGDRDYGPDSGSAYLFDGSDDWSQIVKLTASDGAAIDRFGHSLAMSGDLAIVGAPGDDDDGPDSGSAYVFDGSAGWSQVAKLTPSDGTALDQFGYSVAISGDLAVVGAWGDDDSGSASGSAYVFDGSAGWSQVAKLTALDGAAGDQFGHSVAISGNLIVIGAQLEDDSGSDSGSGYVFDGSAGWSQVAKLTFPPESDVQEFGRR